jgi:hypothetical protein
VFVSTLTELTMSEIDRLTCLHKRIGTQCLEEHNSGFGTIGFGSNQVPCRWRLGGLVSKSPHQLVVVLPAWVKRSEDKFSAVHEVSISATARTTLRFL